MLKIDFKINNPSAMGNFLAKILGKDQNSREDFLGDYKLRNPREAAAIERMSGESFSLLTNKDAKEKIASLQRLARNNSCDITQVKSIIVDEFIREFGTSEEILDMAIHRILQECEKESIRFNISRENTGSAFMAIWLAELKGML